MAKDFIFVKDVQGVMVAADLSDQETVDAVHSYDWFTELAVSDILPAILRHSRLGGNDGEYI